MKNPTPALRRLTLYTGFVLVACFVLIIATEYFRLRVTLPLYIPDDERLHRIATSCGALCDPEVETKGFDEELKREYRRVPLSPHRCRALYTNPYIFTSLPTPTAIRHIRKEMRANFSMNGRLTMRERYFNDVYLDKKKYAIRWNCSYIEGYLRQLEKGNLQGTFGKHVTNELLRILRLVDVRGKRVLVVGSQKPWCEAIALVAGASETVTLEMNKIHATHPKMKAYTPNEFSMAYLADNLQPFDVVIAYSTSEHSGLSRYGDSLNPWGDIIGLGMVWCVTKNSGTLVLEVPRARSDEIVFNMHRYYGPKRLPHLTTNWVRMFDDQQDLWKSPLSVFGDLARPMVFKRMQ